MEVAPRRSTMTTSLTALVRFSTGHPSSLLISATVDPKRFRRSTASDCSIQQANRKVLDRRHILGLYLAEPMLTLAAHHTKEACS